MITAFFVPAKGDKGVCVTDADQVLCYFQDREGLLWVDMENATEEETSLLETRFGIHPVAVQACRDEISQPLVHSFDDYLFLVIHAVDFRSQEAAVTTTEVDILWGRHFLLTYHRDPVRSITEVRNQCRGNGTVLMARGLDFFLHAVVDRIIDNFWPALGRIDDRIEESEKAILSDPTREMLQGVLDLKRSTMHLSRIAAAQRDVMGRIARGEFPQVTKQSLAYWREAYDHLLRMVQATDIQRDLISSLREAYLSVVSNRLNEVMKVLTIIATIFIPITFVTGIFGMNFEPMWPKDTWWGYPATMGLMLLVSAAMLCWFRRKKWI